MLDGHGSIRYTYDRNGLRTAKHRGTEATRLRNYIYEGGKLVAERWVGSNGTVFYNHYQYDATGLCGFVLTRSDTEQFMPFAVITDTFGSVQQIRSIQDDSVMAEYAYDAWGQRSILGNLFMPDGVPNLFLDFVFGWKGHELDSETNLYYIDGRWYDPQTGRFINCGTADQLLSGAGVVNGLNMYLYAFNDGVNAVGNSHSIESAYEMESAIPCRVQQMEEFRRRRRINRIVGIVLLVVGAILAIATAGFGVKKGIGLMAAGGGMLVAGVALSAMVTLAAAWSITNSIASVAESFCEHGHNFMRDGLLNGNERLHTALAWVAVGAMIAGGVGLSIMKKAFAKKIQMAKVQKWLNKNVKVKYHNRIWEAFGSDIRVTKAKKNTVMNRYWDSIGASELGNWGTPNVFSSPAEAISKLGLYNNMATNMSSFIISKGTKFLAGTIAPTSTQLGGGLQFYVANISVLIPL